MQELLLCKSERYSSDPYAPIKINEGIKRFDENGLKSVTELTGTIKPCNGAFCINNEYLLNKVHNNLLEDYYGLWHALITAPISLLVLFILSKLIGNKQMANLNLFDYINGITIGSIAAEMATNGFDAFFECLIALIIYAAVVILLSYISQKSITLRRFFTGKTIVLYDKGKIYKKNLMTAKIDMNEFLSMLRNKGYFCLEDIETAYLEQNGQLSVLVKSNKSPVTPFDMKIRVNRTRPEVVVISDGKVLRKT